MPLVTVAPPASSTVVPEGSVSASVVVSNGLALRFPKRSAYSSVSPNPTGSRSPSSASASGGDATTTASTCELGDAAPVDSAARAVAWITVPSVSPLTVTCPTSCTVRLAPAASVPRSHTMSRPATQAAGGTPPSVTARQPAVL